MATVSEIWVRVNADVKGLQSGLLKGGTELKAFSATTKTTAATTAASAAKVETAYGGIGGTVRKLGPVFIAAGAAAVGGIVKGIQVTQQWAGEVKSLQRVTGQSAEEASRLATAANTLGISTSTLATSFGLLGKNIINGSANLEQYGIVTKDAAGTTLPFNDILGNIQDKFLSLPKGIEQATFAQNVFGRGGKALIPILSQGRAGLAALESAADKYGTTLSQKDLDASRALTIAQKELGDAFKGAEISIARDFIPVLTSAVEKLTSVVEVIHKIPQPVLSAGLAFVTLAGGAAAAGKVVGFLQEGWSNLGNTLGLTSKTTEAATLVLDENTAAVIANTGAQGSWGVEVNSAANSISTASDVIDAGTKATEASTTAVTADIAAQAAHATAQKGAVATTAAQVAGQRALFDATLLGTGAVGDAAAAQGALFDATNLTTAAIERQRAVQATPIPAAGTGSAGLAQIGNAPLVGVAAVLYGLAKATAFAKDEFQSFFRVLVEHQPTYVNVHRGLEDIGNAMRLFGFAVPSTTDSVGEFTKGVEDIQAGLQDGSVSLADAKVRVGELADKYGIANLNVNTFTDNLATSVGVTDEAAIAAEKHARAVQIQGAAIGQLVSHSKTATSVLGLMGESAAQFGSDARTAFIESDDAFTKWATDFQASAVDAWNKFRDSAHTSIDFTTSMLKDLESSATDAQKTLAGDTSGLSKGALATLRAQAHLTATDILHTFQAAKAQTVSFSKDLLEIGKVGGQAGKDLAASFLAAGDVLAAQVVADAPKKLQDKIVGAFGASEKAADSFSTKLTKAIVGPLEDISGLLEAIARHFGIDVSFLDHGSKGKIDAINTSLRALAGRHRGEVDLDTSRAQAALTSLIARERQAGVSSGNLRGTVSPRQIFSHSGGLVTPAGVFHEGGMVDWAHMAHTPQFHAGGTVSWAHDIKPTKLPELVQNVRRMHVGGLKSDEVPAVLQRGEFVVRKQAVQHLGLPTMHRINHMHEGGAAIGGAVPTFGVRPVPQRNGQMWMDWGPAIDAGARPGGAISWWNFKVGRKVVIHRSGTMHVAADLPDDYPDQTAQAITTFNLRRIRFRHPVRTTPAWQSTNQWVLEHEMGHGFGLGHVTNSFNLMAHPTLGKNLNVDQLDLVRKLWPGGRRVQQLHIGGLASDEIPAVLQRGEFVIRKHAVERIGVPKLRELNRMHQGGAVAPSLPSSSSDGLDEAVLKRAFLGALKEAYPKLYVDRRRFGRDLDQNVLTDGHW